MKKWYWKQVHQTATTIKAEFCMLIERPRPPCTSLFLGQVLMLTLKILITAAANNILISMCAYFSEEIRLTNDSDEISSLIYF